MTVVAPQVSNNAAIAPKARAALPQFRDHHDAQTRFAAEASLVGGSFSVPPASQRVMSQQNDHKTKK